MISPSPISASTTMPLGQLGQVPQRPIHAARELRVLRERGDHDQRTDQQQGDALADEPDHTRMITAWPTRPFGTSRNFVKLRVPPVTTNTTPVTTTPIPTAISSRTPPGCRRVALARCSDSAASALPPKAKTKVVAEITRYAAALPYSRKRCATIPTVSVCGAPDSQCHLVEAECGQADGDGPDHQDATGGVGERLQCAGLIGVRTGLGVARPEADPPDDREGNAADQDVQQSIDGEAEASQAAEDGVVLGLLGGLPGLASAHCPRVSLDGPRETLDSLRSPSYLVFNNIVE